MAVELAEVRRSFPIMSLCWGHGTRLQCCRYYCKASSPLQPWKTVISSRGFWRCCGLLLWVFAQLLSYARVRPLCLGGQQAAVTLGLGTRPLTAVVPLHTGWPSCLTPEFDLTCTCVCVSWRERCDTPKENFSILWLTASKIVLYQLSDIVMIIISYAVSYQP